MKHLEESNSLRQKQNGAHQGAGERTNGEFVCNGYRVSLGKMRVVWVNGADGSVRLYIKD